MKYALLIAVILLLNVTSFGQIKEGSIQYQIEITDEFSGLPLSSDFEIDWQFEVHFSEEKSVVRQKFTKEKKRAFFHNKSTGKVLALYDEFGNRFVGYSQAQGTIIEQTGHRYPDTAIVEYAETKEILGYKCRKIEYDFGAGVKATYWVTDAISVGTIVPESPLDLDFPALEYIYEGTGMKIHFVATEISTKTPDAAILEEEIPEGYHIIVPYNVYDQSLSEEEREEVAASQSEFIEYPAYPGGREALFALFSEMPAYQAEEEDFMEGEDGELFYFGQDAVAVGFYLDSRGKISNIQMIRTVNPETEAYVLETMERMSDWNPARVKTSQQKLPAQMMITLILPIKR